MSIHTVVFDLGGVLIDWNPRYLYDKLIDDPEEKEYFLSQICTPHWNAQQDAGRSFRDAVEILIGHYPHYEELIRAYHLRWDEMLGDADENVVALLRRLKSRDMSLYALTNWSSEKFPVALERFDFLSLFDGILVSGEVKLKKPDPEIFQLFLKRYSIQPDQTVFIDDTLDNVQTARSLGFQTIFFQNAEQLTGEMYGFGLF